MHTMLTSAIRGTKITTTYAIFFIINFFSPQTNSSTTIKERKYYCSNLYNTTLALSKKNQSISVMKATL